MDSAASVWILVGLIFAAALIVGLLQRHARDHCLKKFRRHYVLIELSDGSWVAGTLEVLAKSAVLSYETPQPGPEGHVELSYALYEENVAAVRLIASPVPRQGSLPHREWQKRLEQVCHPSAVSIARRSLRNGFNMIRDAFSQAIAVLVGTYKQRLPLGRIAGADAQATQVGQKLLEVVPNSYEQILEKYLFHDVVIEIVRENQRVDRLGVLEEYSDKFLLIRDVTMLGEVPPDSVPARYESDRFDVILPRKIAHVRHLARRVTSFDPALNGQPKEPVKATQISSDL
jgi:hypothetical protein